MTTAEEVADTYRQFLAYRQNHGWQTFHKDDPRMNELVDAIRKPVMFLLHHKIGANFDESAANEKFFDVLSLPDGHIDPKKFLSFTVRSIYNGYLDSFKRWPHYVDMPEGMEQRLTTEAASAQAQSHEELDAAKARLAKAFIATLRTQNDETVSTVLLRLEGNDNHQIAEKLGAKMPAIQMRFSRFNDRLLNMYAMLDTRKHDTDQPELHLEDDLHMIKEAKITVLEMLAEHGFDTERYRQEQSARSLL